MLPGCTGPVNAPSARPRRLLQELREKASQHARTRRGSRRDGSGSNEA